jgi:hypothetical protein
VTLIPKGQPKPKVAKAKAKKPNKTAQLRKADSLFSKLIRSRGRCEHCGSGDWLQCAHGFSRRYRAVRFDERNAWVLCRSCHVFYTHRPLEWDGWMRDRMGVELYEEIRALALTGPNPDLGAEILRLESRLRSAA